MLRRAKQVAKIDKEVLYLIKEMKQALLATRDPEGVGLAAPQVGKSLQLFITRPNKKSQIQVFINPVIQTRGDANQELKQATGLPAEVPNGTKEGPRANKQKDDTQLEGCLSLPNIWGEVNRSQTVELSFLDENGKPHKRKFSGFTATIIQHEYDHLNAVLFPKRVLEQKGKLYKSHKNKEGKDVFEEIEL